MPAWASCWRVKASEWLSCRRVHSAPFSDSDDANWDMFCIFHLIPPPLQDCHVADSVVFDFEGLGDFGVWVEFGSVLNVFEPNKGDFGFGLGLDHVLP